MLPKKSRHPLYAVLLLALFVVGTSAIASSKVFELFADFSPSSITAETTGKEAVTSMAELNSHADNHRLNTGVLRSGSSAAPLFMTIIQGADARIRGRVREGRPV